MGHVPSWNRVTLRLESHNKAMYTGGSNTFRFLKSGRSSARKAGADALATWWLDALKLKIRNEK